MDWKQLFAIVIGLIVWPAAVIAILTVFKIPFERLILQTRKSSANGVDAELAEQAENARSAGQVMEAEQNRSPRRARD